MTNLYIRLLGNLEVSRDEKALPPPSTRKARSLLGYLLLHRQRLHSRDSLAGEFWGEVSQDRARKSLRTTLWRIRRGLSAGKDESPFVVEGEYVGFDFGGDVWLDVREFERRLDASRAPGITMDAAAAEREAAIRLYRGPLLEECYDDWCLRERERLRERYVAALEGQLHYAESRGDWQAAIALGEELLHLDPLRENVHRDLMRCRLLEGSRPAALQQYAACVAILERELGVEPMSETTVLYEQIRDGVEESWSEGRGETAAMIERAAELLGRADSAISRMSMMIQQLEMVRTRLQEQIEEMPTAVTTR